MSADDDPTTETARRSGDDAPQDRLILRVAALVGAASFPLAMIGSALSDPNSYAEVNPGSSDTQLLAMLSDSRTEQLWAATLQALAAVAVWVFLGPLWQRLRRGSEWLALLAVVGGAVAGAAILFWAGHSLVAMVAADFEDAEAARFLMVAGWETARVAVAPYLVLVGAATLAGRRGGALPAGINAFGVVFVVLLALGFVPGSPAGLLGTVGSVWVTVVALALAFTHPSDGDAHEAQVPAAEEDAD
ncbi:hypothetical protein [Isoptericola sp. NPDC057391]|uniref:hypothetical protein n=1 Tax=Isoptericola sp. NPDC057391 TaxID=3346117 RepID=UPI00363F0F35